MKQTNPIETRNRIRTGEFVKVRGRVLRSRDFFALPFAKQMQLLHGRPEAKPAHREPVAPVESATLADWRRYERALRAELAKIQQLSLFGDDPDVSRQKASRRQELATLVAHAQKQIQTKVKESR